MKKLLASALVLTLALSLLSCGKQETSAPDSKKAEEYINSQKEEIKESKEEKQEAETPEEKPLPSAEMPEVESLDDWKDFLAEYEAWVDEYIAVFNKYKNNRQDQALLLEYAKMQQQLAEWKDKTEEYVIQLEVTPEVLEEYTNAIARIAVKLTEGTMQ